MQRISGGRQIGNNRPHSVARGITIVKDAVSIHTLLGAAVGDLVHVLCEFDVLVGAVK
jgi:hypothetical protein